ncbi:peptide ABC transporter ATPase [Thermosipho melanesiensis]|uniref:Oligopeptide/dipeptide ABC transporter, ATPase subunit n=2 Tax=Thermosipho melanesiensis TaxID=46541 RepID=A6LM94_THEM4|nr:ABC transporter ATP-binding protein [Thermosipho melanesiensis]ABR31045.1 oligopeptide/dipeptide ABC transporter, ATPase subunit [Thermosipho melanesiensis BI429]APT74139.1 peptide ABC transporter ATPase [Thermosipho melanesiensis]OOC36086.1 peptide ABC transporter ATPase [Thermosipho melanesiensis]OOC36903.1 peptide ABC transporter ATPase [Thermosipho melanesiensis]OOC37654.1 peptide ABC transporter ATPase [Thermosipho melanesiensis]
MTIFEAKNLKVYYKTKRGYVKAVDNINFSIEKGQVVGLVGESGCGKSTFGQGILKILPPSTFYDGYMSIEGKNLVKMSEKEIRVIRGKKIGMIFQDPMTSLNPIMKIEKIFYEALKTHEPEITLDEARERTAKVLEKVGIEPERMKEYSFQFSGGMRQRAMIALSLVLNPTLVIADEPTTSLDVIVQAQIMELLGELRKEYDMSMILITHDLGVVAETADKICVMYAGHIVEEAKSEDLYYSPKHPYTKLLLKSIPNTNIDDLSLKYIPGSPPDLLNPPKGCRFAERCPFKKRICELKEPEVVEVNETKVKCWLYSEVKV